MLSLNENSGNLTWTENQGWVSGLPYLSKASNSVVRDSLLVASTPLVPIWAMETSLASEDKARQGQPTGGLTCAVGQSPMLRRPNAWLNCSLSLSGNSE